MLNLRNDLQEKQTKVQFVYWTHHIYHNLLKNLKRLWQESANLMALAIKNKIQKAGSYVVDKAELITSAGVKENLIGAFVHIQFYEDIESGSITGQCLLNDLLTYLHLVQLSDKNIFD